MESTNGQQQLADDLRSAAQRVFDRQHPHARRHVDDGTRDRPVADIPNGVDSILRISWASRNGSNERLSIRGYLRAPDGTMVPMSGFGLNLAPGQLPGLAHALASALLDLEVTSTGIKVRTPPRESHYQAGKLTNTEG